MGPGAEESVPGSSAHLLSPLKMHSWAPGSSPIQNTNLGGHLGTGAHQAHPRSSQALFSAILFSSSECLSTSLLKHIYVRSFCCRLWQPVSMLITCPLSQRNWARSLDPWEETVVFFFSFTHVFLCLAASILVS